MYANGTIRFFLDELAGNKAAPGGGSASACAGAMGAALACMTANFTLGKKKFIDVEDKVAPILERTKKIMERLAAAVDADVEAYDAFTGAMKLPKETDEEKAARSAAMQKALRGAMEVPLEVMRDCAALLDETVDLVKFGNPNLVTDAGCAALFALAALRGARLNVEINLASIKDEPLVGKTKAEIEELTARATEAEGRAMEMAAEKLG